MELYLQSVKQLRKLASELGVSGRNEMNKGQLIDALTVPLLLRRIERLERRVFHLETVAGVQESPESVG